MDKTHIHGSPIPTQGPALTGVNHPSSIHSYLVDINVNIFESDDKLSGPKNTAPLKRLFSVHTANILIDIYKKTVSLDKYYFL